MVDAVVLAGGLGTRIRHLAGRTPKVLLDVGGRPFVEILLSRIREQGFSRAVLCVGSDGDAVRSRMGDGSRLGMLLKYSGDGEALGTAGALALAAPMIRTDPFVVLNGDTVCDVDVAEVARHHREKRGLVTVVRDRVGIPAGAYAMSLPLLSRIPPWRPCSLERDVIPRVCDEGLCGLWYGEWFVDIGTPEGLARAREMFKEAR